MSWPITLLPTPSEKYLSTDSVWNKGTVQKVHTESAGHGSSLQIYSRPTPTLPRRDNHEVTNTRTL